MPVRYDITLSIRYHYDAPASAARVLLRMAPRITPTQRLLAGEISADPVPRHRADEADFFGNPMTVLSFDQALSDVHFRFQGRVSLAAPDTRLDLSCPLAELSAAVTRVNALDRSAPHHFLGVSERVGRVGEIAAFAREIARPDQTTLETVVALSRAFHGHFTFDPQATDVATDPGEAFRNRRGVCQDISHAMICGLRALGVPAGYVSGFLRTEPPEGQPRLTGADAMHAWVRAWCGPQIGWVEIDPTNDLRVGTDHVVVGYGRDYVDVSPVKGSLRSAGAHSTTHAVDMVPVDAGAD